MPYTVLSIPTKSRQAGQAIVLIALLILVLFGMLGLAIDSGRAYVDRRDQQAAIDAAALSAGDWYLNYFDINNYAVPKSVVLYQNNLRLYSGYSSSSHTTAMVGPNNNLQQDTYTYNYSNYGYTLTIVATNNQFNGYQFVYTTSHNLPLAFIQIFGGSPQVNIQATATSIVGNQRQTPALLTLSTGACATTMQGAGQLTIVGDAYTNGQACINASLKVGGNCYASSGNCNAATFLCITSSGSVYPPVCNPGDSQGAPYVPAPTLPDPGYLAPEQPYYTSAGTSSSRGTWTEMTPGTWTNFSLSSGGCYFLDPGVYTWNGGYTSHGALVSNELKPPTEENYQSPGSTTATANSFWGSQGCDGAFNLTVVPAPGNGIKHNGGGNWGVELTSVRYDRFLDSAMNGNVCYTSPGCMRESAPSVCQQINELDSNSSGIDVNITTNAPGAQYYNVYVDPYGCETYPGGNRGNFSFYGTFLAPGWTDAGSPPATTTGLGPWNGTLITGRLGWSPCPVATVTVCNIDYNGMTTTNNCAFFNARAKLCRAPWDEQAPQCFPSVCAAGGAPQENAPMALEYPPYNGGDIANENYCQQTPTSGGSTTAPCSTANVTPGAVQFYFPAGNNCVDQNGNGSTHVFSGKQYNWIVIYQAPSTPGSPPNTYCSSQKLNGNSYTQYIGTLYSPTSSWNITGANTAPLAGQVIAYTATVTGSGNAGILFNPNFAPAPPAARLIN